MSLIFEVDEIMIMTVKNGHMTLDLIYSTLNKSLYIPTNETNPLKCISVFLQIGIIISIVPHFHC